MPEMKLPSEEHPITIVATPGRVRGMFNGHLIVDSAGALTLKEASYKAVQYIPRDDVSMAFLHPTGHRTYCPYKGYASYFSLVMDGEIAENAVWSYEEPYPAMSAIAGALAFYPNHVEVYQLDEPHASTDEAILHTDSGSGRSQREHWQANVTGPDDPNPLAR
jgi:uncharacterized protein (DUF427 family)